MGILKRFSSIMKANINDLLDKAEDPSKMIDQYMRELTESLAEVKQETANVMAEETRTKRLYDDAIEEVNKYDDLARRALKAGNEGDAKVFIAAKQKNQETADGIKTAYDAAVENATKMREMHDKLVNDIQSLNSRRETIKAKVAVAKTQNKVNEIAGQGASKAEGAMSAFERMEAKADQMLDSSNAMTELNTKAVAPEEYLREKYEKAGNTASVDDELERMKKELGL